LRSELKRGVPQHGAGQQAGFQEHLETIADSEHKAAIRREPFDSPHDG
jgi:hypothetical protein